MLPEPDFNVIASIHDNEDNLRQLTEQLETSMSIIPFVGAGLSIPLGFPGWSNFLLNQAKKAGIEERIREFLNAGKYEEAAEDLLTARGYRAFHDAINNTFGDRTLMGKELNGAVSFLPKLPVSPIITTNFDHVLEEVFKKARCSFEHKVWGVRADLATIALHQNRRFLLKIHGDVEDSVDRVLTKSDYQKQYGSIDGSEIDFSLPLPRLLEQMLISRPLLFIGCSLNQDRTIFVLERISKKFRSIAHYAIVEQPVSPEQFYERSRFLSDLNIRPIWYSNGRHEFIESILAHLINEVSPKANVKDKKDRSSRHAVLEKHLLDIKASLQIIMQHAGLTSQEVQNLANITALSNVTPLENQLDLILPDSDPETAVPLVDTHADGSLDNLMASLNMPEPAAIKFGIYTLACREMRERMSAFRFADETDSRIDLQSCLKMFDDVLRDFFYSAHVDSINKAFELFIGYLEARADLFHPSNANVTAIFKEIAQSIRKKYPSWKPDLDIQSYHIQGRDLAREFYAASPYTETQDRLKIVCNLKFEYRRKDIYPAVPMVSVSDTGSSKNAQSSSNTIIVRFSFEQGIDLYLLYPLLFLHEYISHIYGTDYRNTILAEGWLLYAAKAFLQRKFIYEGVDYFYNHMYPNLFYNSMPSDLDSIARVGFELAEMIDAWLSNPRWFTQTTYELAAFIPKAGQEKYWPTKFLYALRHAFYNDRKKLADNIRSCTNLSDLMVALEENQQRHPYK